MHYEDLLQQYKDKLISVIEGATLIAKAEGKTNVGVDICSGHGCDVIIENDDVSITIEELKATIKIKRTCTCNS